MMKWSTRMFLSSSSVILMILIVLTTLFTPSLFTRAAEVTAGKGPRGTQYLKKGPATLVVKNSRPLHRPVNPPRSVTFVKRGAKQQSPAASTPKPGALQINLSSSCPTPTIDLKILVIAADGN